jgi:hypothetical protein
MALPSVHFTPARLSTSPMACSFCIACIPCFVLLHPNIGLLPLACSLAGQCACPSCFARHAHLSRPSTSQPRACISIFVVFSLFACPCTAHARALSSARATAGLKSPCPVAEKPCFGLEGAECNPADQMARRMADKPTRVEKKMCARWACVCRVWHVHVSRPPCSCMLQSDRFRVPGSHAHWR